MSDVVLTPSDEVVAAARAAHKVKDGRGRTLTLVKPNVLATLRLVKILGDTARNSAYMTLVTPITYLTAIDGEPVMQPTSELQLEGLIQQLDEEGLMALIDGVQEHFGAAPAGTEEATLKKS
jgi:hypothetical protein